MCVCVASTLTESSTRGPIPALESSHHIVTLVPQTPVHVHVDGQQARNSISIVQGVTHTLLSWTSTKWCMESFIIAN